MAKNKTSWWLTNMSLLASPFMCRAELPNHKITKSQNFKSWNYQITKCMCCRVRLYLLHSLVKFKGVKLLIQQMTNFYSGSFYVLLPDLAHEGITCNARKKNIYVASHWCCSVPIFCAPIFSPFSDFCALVSHCFIHQNTTFFHDFLHHRMHKFSIPWFFM